MSLLWMCPQGSLLAVASPLPTSNSAACASQPQALPPRLLSVLQGSGSLLAVSYLWKSDYRVSTLNFQREAFLYEV